VTLVNLNRALAIDEVIVATQQLCGRASQVATSTRVGHEAGFGPRPFYVVGHNPNTIPKATEDVNNGANGLEPDVQVYKDHPDQLCISHGPGDSSAPTLVAYLDAVHQLAIQNPHLALVVFDCKQEVTSPDHGFELLMAIRQHLTFDNDLNVILSIAKQNQGSFFDRILDILGPREGLMIDAEDDPGAVSSYFTSRGVEHQGYGNGISFFNFVLGPYYRYTLEGACGIRAQTDRPQFIYVWTVNVHDELREYIRIGVDGAITDDVADLRSITEEAEFNPFIRLANRVDNPFQLGNFNYGLHIHTGDRWMAGTDANVTFTINGSAGSASKTINTKLVKRMESDDWNWVSIPSDDLGSLQSLTVQRDNQGNGPDWFLDRIEVRSARFGTGGLAVFNRWIDTTSSFTAPTT
jgi:glycerophosphoryl diester phosphodiesterase